MSKSNLAVTPTRTGLKSGFVARLARCEARGGKRAKQPEVYPLRYTQGFFAKFDEVPARISSTEAEDTFETSSRTKASSESGFVISTLMTLTILIVAALVVVAFVFGTVVPIGTVGVRKIAFGPKQGLLTKPLTPGFHWTVPGYSTIYRVPQGVRVLDFDRDIQAHPASLGSLDVPTTDGTTVDIDVSILYRFYNAEGSADGLTHGGPADLLNRVGATEPQWSKYLAQAADNELKRSLGALSTVDFYDPKSRQDRVSHAERAMRESLAPLGIRVEAVLLRRYTYREEIDQAIFKKNLQELESAYNKVAGDFAEAQRDVNKVAADGDVAIQNLDKQGVSKAEEIRSEGDLYRRQKVAEADLLVAEARAHVDKLKSEVLAQVGSDTYVALQQAQVINTLKGGVVSNIDPYDFDQWVKKLAGAEAKARMDTEVQNGK
jgi:regulator of protease activity HflC (stomatin/prohibitin superfamily)